MLFKKAKIPSILNKVLIGLFILYTINIFSSGYGSISFLYTALFYFFFYQVFLFLIKKIAGKFSTHFILFITSLFISLFVMEFSLRFILKKNLTYAEQNGSFNYASFYVHSKKLDKKKRKRSLGEFSELLVGQPNTSKKERKSEFTYEHKYNSLGLRSPELKKEKEANEVRIIGLGDSFTEGMGAPQDSSWVELLEDILSKQLVGKKVNCINGGKSGSDPVFEYQLFKEELLDYKPDLVILALNGSDPRDIFIRGGHERYDNEGQLTLNTGPWWEYFYGTSYIVRLIVRDGLKYNDYLVKDEGFELKLQQAFDVIYEKILQFQELAEANNFEFKIVFMPFYGEMYKQSMQLDPLNAYLLEQGMADQVIFLPQCYGRYMNYFQKEPLDYYWEVDSHHNSDGYKMMAECIAESLLK